MPKGTRDELLDGKALIETKSKVDLIKRLTGLSQLLKECEQGPTEESRKSFDSIADALVHSSIIQNKDKDVRLQASCCLADIIRLFAPSPPYDEKHLERVFSLFIEQLRGLEQVNSPSFARCFYLLERLSVVKAFILIVDLNDDLLVSLFKTFFSIISAEHSNKVVTHMLDVMSACIDDCDRVSQPLLDAILSPLLPPGKNENPKATSLAQQLISRCAVRLQRPISEFLSSAITTVASSDLKDESHSLFYELFLLSPALLKEALPSLESELRAETDEVRENAVKLVCRMIANSPDLDGTYRGVCTSLLARMSDPLPAIRIIVLQAAPSMYAKMHEHREALHNQLVNRVRDVDEKVRKTAVTSICEIAADYSDAIPKPAIEEAELRLRDKKPAIRREAIVQLGALYNKLSVKFGRSWSAKDIEKYGSIPSKVLSTWVLGDDACRLAIEKSLDEDFIQPDATTNDRTNQLVELVSRLEASALEVLARLLKEKKQTQTDLQAFLDARRKKPIDLEEIAKCLRTVALHLSPGSDKSLPALQKFEEKSDSGVWKNFATLISAKSRYSEIKSAKSTLLKREKNPVIEALIYRITQTLLPIDGVSRLLSHLQSSSPSEALVSFVSSLSLHFPALFSESGEPISEMLKSDDVTLVDLSLALLANTGTQLNSEVVSLVKKDLSGLCTSGTPTQVKHAIRALLQLVSHQDPLIADTAKKATQAIQKENSAKALASLTVLSVLARNAPKVFGTHRAAVFDFVLDTALPMSGERLSVEFKTRALKLLTNAVIGVAGPPDEKTNLALAKKVMPVLFDIIQKSGEVTEDAATSEADKNLLHAKAACCLLKLAKHPEYDSLISPRLFESLAWTAQDASYDVRSAFATKLQLFANSFPPRYFAIFALYAPDPDKPLQQKVKAAFDLAIKQRREALKSATSAAAMSHLPEHAVPHLIHLLAHRPQFGEDQEFKFEVGIGNFMLTALTHSPESIPFLIELVRFVKSASDVSTPTSDKHRVVCDILLKLLQQLSDKRSWSEQAALGLGTLPGALLRIFSVPPEGSSAKEAKLYLPAGWHLPDMKHFSIVDEDAKAKRSSARKSDAKPKARRTSKRKKEVEDEASSSEGEEEEEENGKHISSSRETPRKSSRVKSPRVEKEKDKDEDDDEDDDDEKKAKDDDDESSAPSSSPPPSPSSKKSKNKRSNKREKATTPAKKPKKSKTTTKKGK